MLCHAVYSTGPLLCDHPAQHISSPNILFHTIWSPGFVINSEYLDDYDDDDDLCNLDMDSHNLFCSSSDFRLKISR